MDPATNIGKVASELLDYVTILKFNHWTTKSYPNHIATSELADALYEKSDKLIESLQGSYDVRLVPDYNSNKTELLPNFAQEMRNNIASLLIRYELIEEGDSSLQNIVDDMVADVDKYLYFLQFR